MADNKRYFWLKLKDDFFRQKEIKKLRKIAGGDTYTIIYLKMLLKSLSNDGVLYFEGVENDFIEELALDIDEHEENVAVTVQFLISHGILVEVNDDEYLLTTCADMVGSESASAKRMRKHRQLIETQQSYALPSHSDNDVTDCDTRVTTCDTEKEIEIYKEKDNINCASDNAPSKPSKAEINAFFETIWDLYPRKKGKGQVSDSKKGVLYSIGIDEMTRAIDRYKTDLSKEEWRKPQNGSTFFNSGYVDYLDANYEPLKPSKTPKSNNFNNFPQREYDYDALERELLGK